MYHLLDFILTKKGLHADCTMRNTNAIGPEVHEMKIQIIYLFLKLNTLPGMGKYLTP